MLIDGIFDTMDTAFQIKGYHTPDRYLHYLEFLKTEAIKKLTATLPLIDPFDICFFYKQVSARILEVTVLSKTLPDEYARVYLQVIKELEDWARVIIPASSVINQSGVQSRTVEDLSKIEFGCSVTYLAALMQMLHLRKILVIENVAEFSRQVKAYFRTPGQPDMSAHSFRNAFDNPSIEVLEKLLEDQRLLVFDLERTIERLSR